MLRQIILFEKQDLIYVQDFAIALGSEELDNIKRIIQKYIDLPVPGKTVTNHVTSYQIFHRSSGNLYFVFITDIIDSLQYIESIMLKAIDKFNALFPNPQDVKQASSLKSEFSRYLSQLQKDLHSKIAIIGPTYGGKTTLFNLLKSGEEKTVMDVVKTSAFEIDGIGFDLWDFQIRENFSPLWVKIISGSDLVILLFNLANYHVKIINHFLSLFKTEGKYSKLLLLGNKRELVDDHELRKIKNELNITEFEEISLNSPDAKVQILSFLKEIFGLKKEFPKNFGALVKEVDNLVLEGKNVQALAKYKELISTSKSFQNIIYTKALEEKISELNKKIKEQIEIRKEVASKKEFTVQKSLVFTRKISVKPLPAGGASDRPSEEIPLTERISTTPKETLQKMVSFQKLDKVKAPKPIIIKKKPSKLKVKLTLPKTPKGEKADIKPVDTKSLKPKMPMEIFSNEEIVKEMDKPKRTVIDFPKELRNIIKEAGSTLSLQLCEHLITELKDSLNREISLEDIKMAANFFIKQEQLT